MPEGWRSDIIKPGNHSPSARCTFFDIGGIGGIGKWFAGFFTQAGFQVHVIGRSAGLPLPELAARCRVVIVAVPIAATLDVIRLVGPHLPEDLILNN